MPPKRKSVAPRALASKKPKISPIITLGKAALKTRGNGDTLGEDEVSALAAYTQHLETQVEAYQKTDNFLNRKSGKELSRAEIEADAERLKGNIERGIEKLMKVSWCSMFRCNPAVNEMADSGNRHVKPALRRSPSRGSVVRLRSWPIFWDWINRKM